MEKINSVRVQENEQEFEVEGYAAHCATKARDCAQDCIMSTAVYSVQD